MTRLIDADALKRKFKAERGGLWAMSVVDSMQTVDAVEAVVRCEDCKHFDTKDCADGFGWCKRNGTGHGSTDDWFCADGERKEQNDE